MTAHQQITDQFSNHPWVSRAYVHPVGVALVMSASGVAALRRGGRDQLLETLQAELSLQSIAAPPLWRLLHETHQANDAAAIGALLAEPRPSRPIVLAERAQPDQCTLELQLPLDLVQFDGHFTEAPVLPGVAQIGWALAEAAPRLGTSLQCREMEALKFQQLLHPGDAVTLSLRFAADVDDVMHGKLHFTYQLNGALCSSGRLRVERRHG